MSAIKQPRRPMNDNPDNGEVFAILYEAQQRLRALGYSALVSFSHNSVTHSAYALVAAELRHDVLVATVALERGSELVDLDCMGDTAAEVAAAAAFYDRQD